MSHSRALALLLATVCLLAASVARAQFGIQPIPDQDVPSGKTLVVPIPATDPGGPPRSYTVKVGQATVVSGSTTVSATAAGIVATVRTGDPHFNLGVSYTGSNSVAQTGTMEFQLLREFVPVTAQIIGGLTEGGFYSPRTSGTSTKYITFHRIVSGFAAQGGDPNGDGTGGPGFTFPDEFNSALIFSGTAGQLAMANSGHGITTSSTNTKLSLNTLHSFSAIKTGTNADGASPVAGLVTGTNGTVYGTAKTGGVAGAGTVYQYQLITSGSPATTSGSFSALYSFTGGSDGGTPNAGLVIGTDGNLYGATETSGSNGGGTVFKITTSGSLTTLHSFSALVNGTNAGGANPYAGLIQGTDGNFYGTTEAGGAGGEGTVYRITTSGSFTTLYSFSALVTGTGAVTGTNTDGANPYAGLVQGFDGNFYGTTVLGGTSGAGTAYQLQVVTSGSPATLSGSLYSLYSFTGGSDGGSPYAGLIQANDGNFYGTTVRGGASTAAAGTVYQLQVFTTGSLNTLAGSINTLHSFTNLNDGGSPYAGLVEGSDGNLYGTTETSGTSGVGTVFEISTSGALNAIHTFGPLVNGTNADGANPYAGLITGTGGSFYGTTEAGGTNGRGTVFQITGTNTVITPTSGENGTNGSQFFISLASSRSDLDYRYNIFGQLVRGSDTLSGIASTPVQPNGSGEDSSPISPVDITSATVTHNDTDAVLLLSATGVCDAVVTVTAVSGTASTTGTFTAHAVADTINDPPFMQNVPDSTAPNGAASVPLQGTDLQLDLLRYGYQRILPALDSSATTGSSSVVSIPLISNVDNTEAGTVDHWNASSRGPDVRVFHIGAGDKPLRGSLSPIPAGRDHLLALPVAVPYLALFTAGDPKDTASSFTASVNWGDGTYVSGTNVSIVKDTGARTVNRYQLIAKHQYNTAGEFPIIVKIADAGGARLTLNGTAFVSPSSIAISGTDIYRTGGALENQVVATFDDNGGSFTAADYAATINWGDGSVSPGTIKSGRHDTYQVVGSHTYLSPNPFTVCATVTRSGSNAASEWSTVHIAGVTAPQIFPPFAQAHLAQVWSSISSTSNVIVTAGNASGANPYGGLATGTDGNLYGTATFGGINSGAGSLGTIFRISTDGSLTPLHSFTGGSDGANPYAGLVAGSDGNLYGATETDGANGAGTVFQITTSGSLTTLYSFTGGSDGGNPFAPPIQGADGNLYGTTEAGGANGGGTVYQMSTSGGLTTLHSFSAVSSGSNANGSNPYDRLVTGTDGNLYGTTETSGTGGAGTVFRITTGGLLTMLHAFTGGSDGGNSYSGLVTGTDGNLYGTTEGGGSSSAGTVFKITTSGSFTSLYSFTGVNDGGNPFASLVSGPDGNLYGTTESGGANGAGTVFKITTSGSFTSLRSFGAISSGTNADGSNPFIGGLVVGPDGNLYGTTESSGTGGAGTVFQITTGGALTTLNSFVAPTFQIALRCSVAIVNSGNRPSAPGSFAVYVDPNGALDGEQTAFTSNGESSFPIPALQPGDSTIFQFQLKGSVVDSRLKLPVGFAPGTQQIIGVVTYSDPVGDFDGSQKIFSPGRF